MKKGGDQMRKLRINFKTLLEFMVLWAFAFLVAHVVFIVTEAYGFHEILKWVIIVLITAIGLGFYYSLKTFLEIERR